MSKLKHYPIVKVRNLRPGDISCEPDGRNAATVLSIVKNDIGELEVVWMSMWDKAPPAVSRIWKIFYPDKDTTEISYCVHISMQ